jgi:hypothetical protein
LKTNVKENKKEKEEHEHYMYIDIDIYPKTQTNRIFLGDYV